jgi:hypothetical protein
MSATLTASIVAEGEQRLVLTGIRWGPVRDDLGCVARLARLRMIYLDGRLTFLGTSRRHDWFAERLGYLVASVANGCGIPGRTRVRQRIGLKASGAGVEGDKTYYFGPNAERMLGRRTST